MMTEIWWKVFLASIVTVVLCKLFSVPWGAIFTFCVAFLGWTAVIFILLLVGEPLLNKLKKKKNE